MAGTQTSKITTAAADDLTIQPATGKKTLLKSVNSSNPGQTPLATASDGEVKALKFSDLDDIGSNAADDDLFIIHDTSDGNKTKKILASELLGGGTFPQPPFGELPTFGGWVDVDSVLAVKSGGNGSTADLKNSVEFAVASSAFNQSDKNVVTGDVVEIRWMQSKLLSANHGQTISGTLYAKSGSSFTQTWNLLVNKQPGAGWNLLDLTGQPVSTQITSAVSLPTGMNAPSPVSIDGGTLTGIQVSINGGAFTSSPGNILSGQSIKVRGTTGSSNSTGYTALVSIGGLQRTWTVTTAAPALAVKDPTITSPANNATNLGNSITASSSAYQALNGAGTHLNSDWELKKGGVLVISSMASASNKTSWAIPQSSLEENTTYTIRVKHRSNDPVDSSWSAESTFTTGTFGFTPGDPIEGGWYGGQISMTANGVATHNLIMGTKNWGFTRGAVYGRQWDSNENNYEEINALSFSEGITALQSLGQYSNYRLFDWAKNVPSAPNAGTFDLNNLTGTGEGGYNDWYIPAIDEWYILYFHLPTAADGSQGGGGSDGYNEHSVEPYTPRKRFEKDFPRGANIPLFNEGGAEAIVENYWSATQAIEGNPWYENYPVKPPASREAFSLNPPGRIIGTRKAGAPSNGGSPNRWARCCRRVPV